MYWTSVKTYIQRCRIAGRVTDTLYSGSTPIRGSGPGPLDRVKARFDWTSNN